MNKSVGFYVSISIFSLLFSSWLMFHTFSYDQANSSLLIATKAWSDFGAHIPLIRSFSLGNNWPPEYPLFPGEPIRYHFLFYFLVGMLEKAGMRIDYALNIPSIIGFAGLLMLIFFMAKNLFKSFTVAFLSVIFFLFNGTLSFLTFFQKHPLSSSSFLAMVKNHNFPSFAPWDGGVITAFWNLNIYTNQRHLALAFSLGILYILLLLSIEKKPTRKQLPFLLLTIPLFALLPYFHQPMLLIIGIYSSWYFIVFPKLRIFLLLNALFGAIVTAPQICSLTSEVQSLSWYPGYILHDKLTTPLLLWHFIANFGLHLIFIPVGFILAPRRVKWIMLPLLFLLIIGYLFKFSVEAAANHKFFNFAMVFGNMLTAYALVMIYKKIKKAAKQPYLRFLGSMGIGCIVFFLTLSGIIDLFPVLNDPRIPLADIKANPVAQWIDENTPKDAVFLNSSYLYHPASLAGRKIFLGWPYFPWSAGYQENRMPIMKLMYESKNPEVFCPLFDKYHISYITVEPIKDNPDLPDIDPLYFRSLASPAFSLGQKYAIYTAHALCKR